MPKTRASMWSLVATGAIDINTDSGYGRTRDSDMVLGKSPARISPWDQVAAQVIQIGMTPSAVTPLDTNMVPSGSPDHRPLYRTHRHQYLPPWLLPPGSQTKTWPLAIALAQISPWTWMVSKSFTIAYSSPPSPLLICLSPQPKSHSAYSSIPSPYPVLSNHSGS